MMTNFLASLLLLASYTDAFSFCPPPQVPHYALALSANHRVGASSSTWLHQATEDNQDTAAAAAENNNDGIVDEITPPTPPAAAAVTTDILNSPVFLQRKLEVLQADIAQADEKLAEATKMVEVGKAEWATQLDDLQKEVSVKGKECCVVLASVYHPPLFE
jgi:hypothetical protein